MPLQNASELDAFYAVEDPWAYDEHPDDERRVAALLSALPQRRYRRVLDIGCGNGFLTSRLPGDRILGIDLSSEAIGWARRRTEREGRDIAFEARSVFDLAELPAAGFDLVVVTGVLYRQHIGEAFSLVSDAILRLLEPGGILAHAHIRDWFPHGFPLHRIETRTYPYRDYVHLLEVYRT